MPDPVDCQPVRAESIVINLEGPITRSQAHSKGKICLKMESNHLRHAFVDGHLIANLANNHIMDFGEEGLGDTQKALRGAGIPWFGTGRAGDPPGGPLVVRCDGLDVGLLGYVCPTTHPIFATDSSTGVFPIRLESIAERIGALRRDGLDRVVVSLHWGVEELHYPRPSDILAARRLVDAGADLVIGHHSHCIQFREIYKGRCIYYGLGNCVFPDVQWPAHHRFGRGGSWKKQRRWNRRSLMVDWAPSTNECRHALLHFDDRRVGVVGPVATPSPPVDVGPAYERAFRRHGRRMMLRLAVSRFLVAPRLPRLSHLQFYLGWMRGERRG